MRDYRPKDGNQIVSVFRDSVESFMPISGGLHPPEAVEKLIGMSSEDTIALLTHAVHLSVAEIVGTGEIVGTSGLSTRLVDRFIGSAYCKGHYVLRGFQNGRKGVNVGSLLWAATIQSAISRGFRKIYGFSVPEAVAYYKKKGAVFYPSYDRTYIDGLVKVHYFEVELRHSVFNRIRFEPYFYSAIDVCGRLLVRLRKLTKGPVHSA